MFLIVLCRHAWGNGLRRIVPFVSGFSAVIFCVLRKGSCNILKNIQIGIYIYTDMENPTMQEAIDIRTLAGNMTSVML